MLSKRCFRNIDSIECNIIGVRPIIVGGESLPEFLECGRECSHLSNDEKMCYLFRCSIAKRRRCANCVSYVEGTM